MHRSLKLDWLLCMCVVIQLYQPLSIYIVLVGVEVWTDRDPISIVSTDTTQTLKNFLTYRRSTINPKHYNDNAQLIRHAFLNFTKLCWFGLVHMLFSYCKNSKQVSSMASFTSTTACIRVVKNVTASVVNVNWYFVFVGLRTAMLDSMVKLWAKLLLERCAPTAVRAALIA